MGTSRRTAGRYTPPLLLLSPLHVSPLSRILYYGLMLGPETKHPSLSNVAFSLPPLLSEVLLIGSATRGSQAPDLGKHMAVVALCCVHSLQYMGLSGHPRATVRAAIVLALEADVMRPRESSVRAKPFT